MILRLVLFTQPRNLTLQVAELLNNLSIQLLLLGKEDLKDVHLTNPLTISDSKSQFLRLISLNFPLTKRSNLITTIST